MAQLSYRSIKETLGDLLRACGYADAYGNVRRLKFFRDVKAAGLAYSVEHMRRMVEGERTLQPEAMEAFARLLRVQPEHFREYRIWQIGVTLEHHPEMEKDYYSAITAGARIQDARSAKATRVVSESDGSGS